MQQSKQAKQEIDVQQFVLPTSVGACNEIVNRLWYEFFTPAVKHTNQLKRDILHMYNLTAMQENKLAGFNRVITLTPSTRWKPLPMDEGPESSNKIFVDIIPFTKQKANVVARPATAGLAPFFRAVTTPATSTAVPLPQRTAEGIGKIAQIIILHKQGNTNKEIIAMGYNKTTVSIQVNRYLKSKK